MALNRTSVWSLVRRFGTFACLAALAAAAALRCAPAVAQQFPADKAAAPNLAAGASPATDTSAIEGFRHAHFGMSESQLRQAIGQDFPAAAGRFSRATHPSEKTTLLTGMVENLLPDTGPARISYILGYASKRLIQVNILWSSDGHSVAQDEAVTAAANILRDHFQAQHLAPPDEVVANRQIGQSAFLVFRAAQPDDHMVVVVLSGTGAAGRASQTPPPPLTLQLSYISDYKHPDVFQIERGRF